MDLLGFDDDLVCYYPPSMRKPSLNLMQQLVDGYRVNIIGLREPTHPEMDIRQEYINRFWESLGWDPTNEQHLSPDERDVIIEQSIEMVDGRNIRQQRPDYLFRLNGFARFVVEAKKPFVDIAVDRDAIFQVKTYAWNMRLPFAILTNFESFRLFDTTIRPYLNEPNRGVIDDFDLRFEDYVPLYDALLNVFGHSRVSEGSLEELLAGIKKIGRTRRVRGSDRMVFDLRGTEQVDAAFLADLEQWRLRFAQAIYRDNANAFPEAMTRHGAARLAEAVQRLLDRLVFIRVCEDRGIESYGRLRETINRASDERLELYPLLVNEFQSVDLLYNGYLFRHHQSDDLYIEPQLLSDFIRSLYLPEGPYRFDIIREDLLGIIYERFLGSEINVSKNGVTAERKFEVVHAKGVFYTPSFVVDTIIRMTVKEKIKELRPLEVLEIKILDPACGSGSFLIAAYQALVDHCVYQIRLNPDLANQSGTRRSRGVRNQIAFADSDGIWHLSPTFRSRLLLDCIFGVDIDAEAVEVSIMSLYLKMLEDPLPANWQRDWLDNRLLPALENNIRCGNSLLSRIAFEGWWDENNRDLFNADADTEFRMNAFNWDSETHGFGRILTRGFDCVIGNPPYIRIQELQKWASLEAEFYRSAYRSAGTGNYDIYVAFIDKAMSVLAADGLLGFITPHKYWSSLYGAPLRRIIAQRGNLRAVIDFGSEQVFQKATTYTAIQIFSGPRSPAPIKYCKITPLFDGPTQCLAATGIGRADGVRCYETDYPRVGDRWSFPDRATGRWSAAIAGNRATLITVAEVFVGVQTSADDIFHFIVESQDEQLLTVRSRDGQTHQFELDLFRTIVSGEDVRPFHLAVGRQVILFPYVWENARRPRLLDLAEIAETSPRVYGYLLTNESNLRARENGGFDDGTWYRFGRSQNIGRQRGRKLCIPRLAEHIRCAMDDEGGVCLDNVDVNGVRIRAGFEDRISLLLLCGILNSELADTFVRVNAGTHFRGGYASFNRQFTQGIPIAEPSNADEQRLARSIERSVQRLIIASSRDPASMTEREKQQTDREVEDNRTQLNGAVYALYGAAPLK